MPVREPVRYDPSAFPPIAVTVDVVALAVRAFALWVLLARRVEVPGLGRLALPGTFVGPMESLGDAAMRAMREKAGVESRVRQFHTFGDVDRDPRMRIVSVGYMALLPSAATLDLGDQQQLCPIKGGRARGANGRRLGLPFDHADIIAAAIASLRADLDHSLWSFGLLPPEFTLLQLQEVHEAIRGRTVNKPAFRKRLLASGKLLSTGRLETGNRFRPAELYRVNSEWIDDVR